jgi:hypothetical protein
MHSQSRITTDGELLLKLLALNSLPLRLISQRLFYAFILRRKAQCACHTVINNLNAYFQKNAFVVRFEQNLYFTGL